MDDQKTVEFEVKIPASRKWEPARGVTPMERMERSVWRAIDAIEDSQDSLMYAFDMIAIGVMVAGYVALLAIVAAWGLS